MILLEKMREDTKYFKFEKRQKSEIQEIRT